MTRSCEIIPGEIDWSYRRNGIFILQMIRCANKVNVVYIHVNDHIDILKVLVGKQTGASQ